MTNKIANLLSIAATLSSVANQVAPQKLGVRMSREERVERLAHKTERKKKNKAAKKDRKKNKR